MKFYWFTMGYVTLGCDKLVGYAYNCLAISEIYSRNIVTQILSFHLVGVIGRIFKL